MTIRVEKLRSTSKVVKERIRTHILEILSEDTSNDPQEQLQAVVDGFHSWYGVYERKRTPNLFEAFSEYLQCLPSEINQHHYFWNMRQELDGWLETTMYTDVENSKWTDDEVQNLYYHLLHRELKYLFKAHSVDTKGVF